MSDVRYTLDPKHPPKLSDEDKARYDALKDEDIDYSDIAELTGDFFKEAQRASEFKPSQKARVTMRLDADVLEWLKSQGSGYQTRANRILRAAMEHQKTS